MSDYGPEKADQRNGTGGGEADQEFTFVNGSSEGEGEGGGEWDGKGNGSKEVNKHLQQQLHLIQE